MLPIHSCSWCSRCKCFGLVGFFIIAAFCAVSGYAAPKVTWQAITDSNQRNIDSIGYFRDDSGVLHLSWNVDSGDTSEIYYRTIDSDGNLDSGAQLALSGWDSLANSSIVVDGAGNRTIFFSGIGPSSPYVQGNVARLTRGSSELSWTLGSSVDSEANIAYASSGVNSALDSSGNPYFAYTTGSRVRYGKQGETEMSVARGSCCLYEGNIVRDASDGSMVVGWYSNISNEHGLYMQQVLPSEGALQYLERSADETKSSAVSISSRTPMVSRPDDGGVFSAYCAGYPTCDRVQVAEYGSDTIRKIPRSKKAEARSVAITAGPAPLMWVAYAKGKKIYLSRSKKASPKFARPVAFKGPRASESPTFWSVHVSAFDGGVDVIVQASPESGGIAFYHGRMTNGIYKKLAKRLKKKNKKRS